MRVLLGHNYYRTSAPSGEDTVVRNEKELLQRGGIEVVSYEVHNDDIDDSSIARMLKIGLETAWSRKTYQAVSRLVKRTRPDIAHFHNTFPQISPSAYAACRDNSVPVIQTLHNYRFICPGGLLQRNGRPCEDCVGTNLVPALWHRCYRGSLTATGALVWMLTRNRWQGTYQTLVDRYIALTNFAASRLVEGGIPQNRLSIKPNFLPDVSAPGPGDGGYAVFAGRLSVEKGLHTLITAWESLREVPLKIFGDGPLREELTDLVSKKALPITFHGFCDRATVLHAIGHAVFQVVPSEWYEGFPMTILEAYASGTPVVCSRIGSLEEIVREGETGIAFKPGDAIDLVRAARSLIQDPVRLHRMRRNARSEFLSRYSSDKNFDLLMDIYHQVLNVSFA